MTKAVLRLDSDGVPLAPATLCADAMEEARKLKLPIFEQVLAELSEGMEMRANGGSRYELWHQGRLVGMLEIFEPPRLSREREGESSLGA